MMNAGVDVLKNHNLPIQIEGFPYILVGFLLTTAGAIVWRAQMVEGGLVWVPAIGTILFALFTLFSIWFYRNPVRNIPNDPSAILSPADGRVLKIEEINGSRIGQEKAKKVSIFMSPLDVHVNRSPIHGVIEKIDYVKGKFFKADLDKASEENEHNWVVMKSERGFRVAFVQIAGFVARRIVCYVKSGQTLDSGERFGMIRFGSRMEVIVPYSSEILVKPGEKTVAGETKLAKIQ
ncbi:MAG: phosphatidylserine decarboxylase family protein [Bacteriovoracia bacterium]